jgi:hypothetical protein
MLARIAIILFAWTAITFAQTMHDLSDSTLLIVVKKSTIQSLIINEERRVGSLANDDGLKFTGLNLGVNVDHPTTAALWRTYDRNIVLSGTFTFRRFFLFDLQIGVPIYRAPGVARRTYFLGSLYLKLL